MKQPDFFQLTNDLADWAGLMGDARRQLIAQGFSEPAAEQLLITTIYASTAGNQTDPADPR